MDAGLIIEMEGKEVGDPLVEARFSRGTLSLRPPSTALPDQGNKWFSELCDLIL